MDNTGSTIRANPCVHPWEGEKSPKPKDQASVPTHHCCDPLILSRSISPSPLPSSPLPLVLGVVAGRGLRLVALFVAMVSTSPLVDSWSSVSSVGVRWRGGKSWGGAQARRTKDGGEESGHLV